MKKSKEQQLIDNLNEDFETVEKEDLSLKRKENKKRKWKFILVCLFLLIAIGIGLYIGYQKLNSNPVSIYKETINNAYNYASKYLKETKKNEFNLDLNNEPFVLSLDANLESNIKELANFTGKNYNLELGLDVKKEIATLNADISENNETIISLLTLLKNDNAYLKSPKLLNKVINLGEFNLFDNLNLNSYLKINDENITLTSDDLDYMLKFLKNSYLSSLDKRKFKLEHEKITINDKEYDSKKIIYTLDKENAERTSKYILKSILKDKKMLECLSKMTSSSKDTIKENIKDSLDNLDFSDYDTLEMIIYTDNFNSFLGSVISDNEGNSLRITCIDKKLNVKIMDSNDNALIYETKDEYQTLKYTENNKTLFEFQFNNTKNELNVDYNVNVESLALNGNITLKDIINTKNKIGASYNISFNTSLDTENFAMKGNFALEKKSLEEFDTKGSVKLEDLSEEELTKMYVTLMDIVDQFGISDLIDGMDNM